jgi:hypothetical protein
MGRRFSEGYVKMAAHPVNQEDVKEVEEELYADRWRRRMAKGARRWYAWEGDSLCQQ